MIWKLALKKTKNNYVNYLNGLSPDYESDRWIMRGRRRKYYALRKEYGVALRKYNPIAFNVGYNEWRMR